VGEQNHEGRAVRDLKMILSPGAKTHKNFVHILRKETYLPHWVDKFTYKIGQEILISVRKKGYDASKKYIVKTLSR
jgi:hypothetical protein